MDQVKPHIYKSDPDAIRQVCVCGKGFLDPVHSVEVKMVRGVAKPTKYG